MFSIPRPISFKSIFLYILLGFLIWYYSSFDLKDRRGKKPTGFFNYLSHKAFKAWFQSCFLDFYSHSCMSGCWYDLLGGELRKGQKCVELMFGTSDAVTQTTISKIEAAEPTLCWEGLLGNSYNHCTLQFHPRPYYLPNKRIHAFI